MPVPKDMMTFFSRLVEKSKKSEINWKATTDTDTFIVTFPDLSITISLVGEKPVVRVQLLNDEGAPTSVITVDDADDEWIAAMSLINSANRKVRKIDQTMLHAMEELGKDGPVGEESTEA